MNGTGGFTQRKSASARLILHLALILAALPPVLQAQADLPPDRAGLTIPRMSRAPQFDDFASMKPSAEVASRMAKVDAFIQERPSDGQPGTQKTEAYLGYDDRNLYVVFLCFDSEPGQVRARMTSRENFVAENGDGVDDLVFIVLDTFNDRRRAYIFQVNPLGLQWDALASDSSGFDSSFDALWYSKGKVTDQGYVVWMSIPFKSLRFSSDKLQSWGILLGRDIPRVNETDFWPRHTPNISGFVRQAVPLHGLRDISPGRNIQFVPYASSRSFRALDYGDASGEPRFASRRAEADAGLDAKVVLKDSLVLDVALNPDFSQVESDEPQIQVNQRFELYYPEKRPFFIENAGYFRTPNSLLFTRRIADPEMGLRLTGKAGKFAVGALILDDRAPGKLTVVHGAAGEKAHLGVVRISRDILRQSSVGFILTDHEFADSHNRVGGVDARFRFGRNWSSSMQAVASRTRTQSGRELAGPAYDVGIRRTGRQFNLAAQFLDRSPGFRTVPGYLPRSDIRQLSTETSYQFRPEGRLLIAWGPKFESWEIFDHRRNRLNWMYSSGVEAELRGQTSVGLEFAPEYEMLRPVDFPGLDRNRGYRRRTTIFSAETNYLSRLGLSAEYRTGLRVHVQPAAGQLPELAGRKSLDFTATLRPLTPLTVDSTYLLFRLADRATGAVIFTDHIARSKWNWQFSRELSLRLIFQYEGLLTNRSLTSLETTRNFNADLLITYLLHPGTALYVGYNSNLQNVDLLRTARGPEVVRTDGFINDARGFFVKLSYLFRY